MLMPFTWVISHDVRCPSRGSSVTTSVRVLTTVELVGALFAQSARCWGRRRGGRRRRALLLLLLRRALGAPSVALAPWRRGARGGGGWRLERHASGFPLTASGGRDAGKSRIRLDGGWEVRACPRMVGLVAVLATVDCVEDHGDQVEERVHHRHKVGWGPDLGAEQLSLRADVAEESAHTSVPKSGRECLIFFANSRLPTALPTSHG